jgi:acyl-CoA reductase-like NAD-dependent aldehyde dehydrogenase
VLRRVKRHLIDNMDQLVETICRVAGKTREHALLGEIWPVCEKLRWTISHGPGYLRPERVSSGLFLHKRAHLEFQPLGVIGAIIPWNYPLQNIMNPAIPALMAGNAVVVKPSEWVAWSSRQFIEILRAAVAAEGYSEDLVQMVQGFAETGRALVEGGVDGVVFIGSVANGRRVIEASAKNLVPLILELGGKDPFVVCDDADLDQAAHAAMNGTFINCGQNCVASERILLFSQIADEFEARVASMVHGLRQGPPFIEKGAGKTVDLGCLTTPLQLEVVQRQVARAIAQGARVVSGGLSPPQIDDPGWFFKPTVLADVTADMEIMHEETFGPVMLLCRVQNEEEAIRIANDTCYGLSSSVFSRDRYRARRIAAAIQAGMTAINDFGGMTYMVPSLTFGGVKHSGFGRLNGREGLRACCNVKAVLDDRLRWRFVSRFFPVSDTAYSSAQSMLRAIYGDTWGQRLKGFASVLRGLIRR